MVSPKNRAGNIQRNNLQCVRRRDTREMVASLTKSCPLLRRTTEQRMAIDGDWSERGEQHMLFVTEWKIDDCFCRRCAHVESMIIITRSNIYECVCLGICLHLFAFWHRNNGQQKKCSTTANAHICDCISQFAVRHSAFDKARIVRWTHVAATHSEISWR